MVDRSKREKPALAGVFRFFNALPVQIYFAVVMAVFVGKSAIEGHVPRVIVGGLILAAALFNITSELQHRSRVKRGRSRRRPPSTYQSPPGGLERRNPLQERASQKRAREDSNL